MTDSRDTAAPTSGSQAPHTFAAGIEGLIERLTRTTKVYNGRGTFRDQLVNPDGPDIAAAIRQLFPPVPEAGANEALVESIVRWGGRCRDCADCAVLGVCDNSGLPCEPEQRREAIRHVLKAAAYYGEHPEFLAPVPEAPHEIVGVLEAARGILQRMSSTYRARNGREVGIQGDDGEKCWIVHSDDIHALEAALSTLKAKADTNPFACPACGFDMGHPGASEYGECRGCAAMLKVERADDKSPIGLVLADTKTSDAPSPAILEAWQDISTAPRSKKIEGLKYGGETVIGRIPRDGKVRDVNTLTDPNGFRHVCTHWRPLTSARSVREGE